MKLLVLLITLPLLAQPIVLKPGEPQLFVDDTLIESSKNLHRMLHQPRKDDNGDKPLLALADEFGGTPGTLEANGSIVFDPRIKKYVMFALGFSPTFKSPRAVRLYRFTSPDATNWIKGNDGTPEEITVDLNDPSTGKSASGIGVFSCCYDAHDKSFPYKGWIWLAHLGPHAGIYYVQSADGRTWDRGPLVAPQDSHRVDQDGRTLYGPSDVNMISPDPQNNRYLALLKFNSARPINGNVLRSRAYLFVDRLDQPINLNAINRVALVPAAEKKNGDEPSDEYYASTAWRNGPLWLGGLKIWHRAGDYPWSAAGSAYLKLAVSRDGLDWKKVPFDNDAGEPEVFIPNGKEGGNHGQNDGGYITEFSQGPLRIGDELIYYYGCSSWGKNHEPGKRVTGGGIFRARLRLDGFVSVDGGSLTTTPLTTESKTLLINSSGKLTVQLLDEQSKVLDQAEVEGDSISHAIKFPIARKTFRLSFKMKDGGHLYSFAASP